ncbi:hypothetical protein LR48_Vigan11g072100 [Vigna angularis]|uniref:Uncharacterized protein n=1 Tax=Phaseolus angularis TaxID=3914 RepID=A0A0L9VRV9_PHAAN|nr:hypothetical protein LR48_Vigan11g072100 [Vigna angularis]
MKSDKRSKSAKREAATAAQRQFTAERHSGSHAGSAEGMQFGQEFNYMGTQFYQSNLNHWWEPHSSMDQSQFWQVAGQFENQPQQQWQQQPFLSGSLDRLEDTLQRFLKNSDSTQKSIEESCKRMEMQLRYINQRLNDDVNTEVNLKEEGQGIILESDKILDEEKLEGDEERVERKEKEELSENQSSRFLSRKHDKHFTVVQDRRLLMERKVGMIPNFAPQFGEQVLGNDWGKLAYSPLQASWGGQYCGGEDAAQPVPPRRARRERGPAQSQTSAETHEAEPFQMRDMYMSLIGAQLQSIRNKRAGQVYA